MGRMAAVEEALVLLNDLHDSRGITYTAIGELIGVGERTVRRWANGEYLPADIYVYRLRVLHGLSELIPGYRFSA